jgi:hypothetical protein
MVKSMTVSPIHSINFRKLLYLLLAIVGSITPWYWLLQEPAALASPALFLQRTFANTVSTAWASDLLISGVAFFSFLVIELKRLSIPRWWAAVYVVLFSCIGLSCALPCFLFHREQAVER